MKEKYKLLFHKKASEFIGTLKLFWFGKMIKKWEARSGQLGYQNTYWVTGKSPIPPSNAIIGRYEMKKGYVPGDTVAMGERFYHIVTVDEKGNVSVVIREKDGPGKRSEVGGHHDGRSLGTAGCIGVAPRDSDDYCRTLDSIFSQECKKNPDYRIPLEVVYR